MTYVSSRAVAEEVVQETWLRCSQGWSASKDGRRRRRGSSTSPRTSLARAARERRCRPFSSIAGGTCGQAEPTVDPERFLSGDDPARPAMRHAARTGGSDDHRSRT
jgi:RNA polymerase sigma-70 factor (ECF subfamily)